MLLVPVVVTADRKAKLKIQGSRDAQPQIH
jgi:hypothetical protein